MIKSQKIRTMGYVVLALVFSTFFAANTFGQTATLRGHIYDEATGEAIPFCNVLLTESGSRAVTDLDGFFIFSDIPIGSYTVQADFFGYDTLTAEVVTLQANQVKYLKLFIAASAIQLQTINVSGSLEQRRNEVNVSRITITPKQIKALPSTGGEADIAQYLMVLPGVISTGDQGGQIYIRGGSPVQNKILLDGVALESAGIPLVDDGRERAVELRVTASSGTVKQQPTLQLD